MENLMENVRDVSHEIEDSLYLFMTIIDIIWKVSFAYFAGNYEACQGMIMQITFFL